jgi:hypothetical protein
VARLILREDERSIVRVTPLVGGVARPAVLTVVVTALLIVADHRFTWVARHHWTLAAVVMGPPALVTLTRTLRWRRHAIVVTNQRVVTMSGVLARQSSSAELGDITVVHVDQRLHERVRRRGAVLLDFADGSWSLGVVRHPGALARLIDTQRRREPEPSWLDEPLVEPEDVGFSLPSHVTLLDEYRRRRDRR